MITLKQIANYFEEGLNAALNEPNIKFHIWAEVGKFNKPFRSGNTVTHYIIGNMRTSSSSNDANLLLMGTNGITIDFAIPLKRPRTNPSQTPQELQAIENGQYQFVQQIVSAINTYFQTARSFVLGTGDNQYSVSYQAGTSLTGVVDIQENLGNYVTATVYVQLYFVKGGLMSNDVHVYFDDSPVPFQEVHLGRVSQIERDVFSNKFISKVISSSSAFSIDVSFPSNSDLVTQATLEYLLNGEPNTAHFLQVEMGNGGKTQTFFMTLENTSPSASGVTIVGTTVSFVELADFSDIVSVPDRFQVGRFEFDNISTDLDNPFIISFRSACSFFVAGKAKTKSSLGSELFILSPQDFEVDEDSGVKYLYVVTDRAVSIVGRFYNPVIPVPFVITKEAKNGK